MAYPDQNALTELSTLKAAFSPPINTNSVTRINVTAGGSGYTSAPTVAITGGGGTGATATAIISGGAVVSVLVNAPGKDYHAAPTIAFSGGAGTGAAATAILANDDVLNDLIQQVSNLIADEVYGLVIPAAQAISETRNGTGGTSMVLLKHPATDVTSVTIDGTVVTEATTATASGWVLDTEANAVHIRGSRFSIGVQNVVIAYTAGLAVGDRRLGMLERACLSICLSWFHRRSRVDQSSVSANGMTSSSFSLADIPSDARMILDRLTPKTVHLA